MKNMRIPLTIMGISLGALLLTIIIVYFVSPSTAPTLIQTPTDYQSQLDQQPGNNKSLIQGMICPQPDGTTPGGLIVAEQIPSRTKTTKYYPGSTATDVNEFSLEVAPGTYEVYLQGSNLEKIALYSQFVTCGSQEYCTDHTSVQFPIEKGQTKSEVNLCDYRWKTRFQESTDPIVISPDTEPTPTLEF